MTAQALLAAYAAGKRDFFGADLRGAYTGGAFQRSQPYGDKPYGAKLSEAKLSGFDKLSESDLDGVIK